METIPSIFSLSTLEATPSTLSPSSSGRRTSNASNSPEFEFWMVRNPSCPEPNLHSADELFADGIIRPLDLLGHADGDDPPDPSPELPSTASIADPSVDPVLSGSGSNLGTDSAPPPPTPAIPESLTTTFTASKRWKDIFKKDSNGKKSKEDKEKEKKKERKAGGGGAGGNGTSAAELNIYLWPFSRSRSAGTGGSRPRMAPAGSRKVSSAPCSRSNSAGESKSRKWPSSPSRGGVHLGRSSPVWQVRRSGSGRSMLDPLTRTAAEKGIKKEGNDIRRSKPTTTASTAAVGGAKAKVLNLNVPMCIGYRNHLSCRSNENNAISIATAGSSSTTTTTGSQCIPGIGTGESGRGSNLFNFRNLFTKKVY